MRSWNPSASDRARRGVEAALITLGQAFLAHPDNTSVRAQLECGEISPAEYWRQLLCLAYRLIFLLIVEDRGLLHCADSNDQGRELYRKCYRLGRLREHAARAAGTATPTVVVTSPATEPAYRTDTAAPRGSVMQSKANDCASDLWENTKTVFRGLGAGEPSLALPPLSGLFSKDRCSFLEPATLDDTSFLRAVFRLCWVEHDNTLVPVNWRDLPAEELGAIYEPLLEYAPAIDTEGWRFALNLAGPLKRRKGSEDARRSSGSYYTPSSLVDAVVDRALEPVIATTIAAHPDDPASAVLELAIADPACGAGHFLLSAARRIASHLTRLQTEGTSSLTDPKGALLEVIVRCLYGVDLNPMAVEICKLSLWLEAATPGLPLSFLDSRIRQGNALLGASPDRMVMGIPDDAWLPVEGEDRALARQLKKRNGNASRDAQVRAPSAQSVPSEHEKLVADAWCAAFVWPREAGVLAEAAPVHPVWAQIRSGQQPVSLLLETTRALAKRYHFFHWHLAFPQVFARGGFDVVLGNPPWIAHAGRAAQPLDPRLKAFYLSNYDAFADYPTTHGMFVVAAATHLRPGGCLGLIVPSSLSELEGYRPTRVAHDRLCEFPSELVDFGEWQFDGVTQPCMALVSRRAPAGRQDGRHGAPWPMQRPDLSALGRHLMERLGALPCLPAALFGERGVQSDRCMLAHFLESDEPEGRFTTPIREGTDVREFRLLRPRFHVDRAALGTRMRSREEYLTVKGLVRQTARYPIAAPSDGGAFRNSLLALFETAEWPVHALCALLNSALVRWLHYVRFRDARQPVLPQVKVNHLRAIPEPLRRSPEVTARLTSMGERLSTDSGVVLAHARKELDEFVCSIYGLDVNEAAMVIQWHEVSGPQVMSIPEHSVGEGKRMPSRRLRR